MKKLLSISVWLAVAVLIFLSASSPARAQVWEEWVVRYNGIGWDEDDASSIAVDADGNVYVTGKSDTDGSFMANFDYTTIKYNPSGAEQWVASYNGPSDNDDRAFCIAADDAGNVYVTGGSTGPGFWDYATIKYNSDGEEQWVARYDGPASDEDEAESIAIDSDGNVYVTGYSDGMTGGGTNYDYATIKYNSAGEEQWVARYNVPGYSNEEYGRSIAVDTDGNVYVTGWSIGSGTYYDYATIKYDSAGIEQWVARYDGVGNGADGAHALCIDDDGNVYVTGHSDGIESGINYDYVTIKYDFTGVEQWVAIYNGPGNGEDQAEAIAVDMEGNVYITGHSFGTGVDCATIKYNSDGVEEWVARYNGPDHDWAESMVVDADGNVYVTGKSSTPGEAGYDYLTIKYDSDGVQQWFMRYNGYIGPGPDNDESHSIALDTDGNIYITGKSWGGEACDYDFATIKYSQSQPLVVIDLTPINPPIQIPASGGSFDFNVTITNSTNQSQTLDSWIMTQLPNSTWYGPVFGPINLTLPASYSLTRLRTQSVPAGAPSGNYIYEGRIGIYPDTIWNSGSFTFEKMAGMDNQETENWMNLGEDFIEIHELEVSPISPLKLHYSHPNPFNTTTVIGLELQVAGRVKLEVFDICGRPVRTGSPLQDGWLKAGCHEVTFDGSGLASGIYIYRLEAGEFAGTGKMVLLK